MQTQPQKGPFPRRIRKTFRKLAIGRLGPRAPCGALRRQKASPNWGPDKHPLGRIWHRSSSWGMAASDLTTEADPAWNRTQDSVACLWGGGCGGGRKSRRRVFRTRPATGLRSFGVPLGSLGLHPHWWCPSNSTCVAKSLPSGAERNAQEHGGAEYRGSSPPAPGVPVCTRTWPEPGGWV